MQNGPTSPRGWPRGKYIKITPAVTLQVLFPGWVFTQAAQSEQTLRSVQVLLAQSIPF